MKNAPIIEDFVVLRHGAAEKRPDGGHSVLRIDKLTGLLVRIESDGTKTTYIPATRGSDGVYTIVPSLVLSGNTTVGGTLGVTGNTTVGGTLGVTGNTTVGGTLGVTGKTAVADIDIGGALRFTDTVWDDLRFPAGNFDLPGVADPAKVDWQPGGSGATFKAYEFAKNDEITVFGQMPHGYKAGTDLQMHVHWTPATYGVAQRGAYVGWKADITMAQYDGVFPASSTVDLSDMVPADCADHQHLISTSVTVSVPVGFRESGMFVARFYRSDTGDDDTWSETLSGRLPLLLEIDLHYQIDKVGSNDELPS